MKTPKAKDYIDYLAEDKKITRKEAERWLRNYKNYGWITGHFNKKKKTEPEEFGEPNYEL